MQVENRPGSSYSPAGRDVHSHLRVASSQHHTAPDRKEPAPRVLEVETRAALASYLELLLNSLRGEALLIATLSYGLRVPLSMLRELRIRDVSITERLIFISPRERPIPSAIMEDIRDHLFENVCGREATIGVTRRDDRLFSEEAFEKLQKTAQSIQSCLAKQLHGIAQRRTFSLFDTQLKMLGAFHATRMRRAGRHIPCPLDSFDKGPRIVRRGRGGEIDAYYRWRIARVAV